MASASSNANAAAATGNSVLTESELFSDIMQMQADLKQGQCSYEIGDFRDRHTKKWD